MNSSVRIPFPWLSLPHVWMSMIVKTNINHSFLTSTLCLTIPICFISIKCNSVFRDKGRKQSHVEIPVYLVETNAFLLICVEHLKKCGSRHLVKQPVQVTINRLISHGGMHNSNLVSSFNCFRVKWNVGHCLQAWSPVPVFTKLFRFRIKIRLKFQNEYLFDYFPLSVKENMIFVYIDMVNVVLDLKWIRLKYMSETINYNTVDPVIYWAQLFIAVATIKFNFFFIKSL